MEGPALSGEILPLGGDWMRIRPDGVGIAQINALIRPVGGGIILTEYSGVVDFGLDGSGASPQAAVRSARRCVSRRVTSRRSRV